MVRTPTDAEMYEALVNRDASFEGVFFTCVKTTGIFCRPTCRAKKPKRENVEFVPTAQAALSAGYRACKMCKPLERGGDRPGWMDDLVEEIARTPNRRITDATLRTKGVDPALARRHFKKAFGMTFQAYQRSVRLGGAMRELRKGAGEMRAAIDNGYESVSGFREAFENAFGDSPANATRNGARPLTADWMQTPVGPMFAIASDDGLCMLEFVDRRALENELVATRKRFKAPIALGGSAVLAQTKRELGEYFDGKRREFTMPLDLCGTDFQKTVWNALLKIPYGQTQSYAWMAQSIGRPSAVRAIGRANGTNQIAIIVPCHRVIGADGKLTGYGGGLWRKQWLLDHEGAAFERELFEVGEASGAE